MRCYGACCLSVGCSRWIGGYTLEYILLEVTDHGLHGLTKQGRVILDVRL
jgi:hypothetical protein